MKKDMQEKRKSHTIQNDKWERKQYMKKSKCNVIKNAMKNRLLMWNTKCNLKRSESDTTCTLFKTENDTKKHIMVCQEGNKTYDQLGKNKKQMNSNFYPLNKVRLNYNVLRRKYISCDVSL